MTRGERLRANESTHCERKGAGCHGVFDDGVGQPHLSPSFNVRDGEEVCLRKVAARHAFSMEGLKP
jgi:hypothetical protein